ncbi:DUF1651 domain-containing protein [Synechococcus sp. AH-551-N17]|nr:DUF1651 domain-containing protein [Synechococcus sp. AH-551-N17]
MGVEGWLCDRDGYWHKRFHRDERSWSKYPKIFIDDGRPMPDGSPALLKCRRHISRDRAEQLWKELRKQGWKQVEPVWGTSAEP